MRLTVLLLILLTPLIAGSTPLPAATYVLLRSVPLGMPDRWDYVVFDDKTQRIYLAHADRLAVFDARSVSLVGEVTGIIGRAHGIAISITTGQGFTDDGQNGQAIAFDLRSLKVIRKIPTKIGADAIAYDPITQRVFIVEGDSGTLTIIDAKTDLAIATISTGEELEYAAADGNGFVFVVGEGKGELLKIDALSARIVARWPAPGCDSPHGLAIDGQAHLLFIGCANSKMAVIDSKDGRVVSKLRIGRGSDAIAFDPVRKRVFSANGSDGTVSAYQQLSRRLYAPLPSIQTTVSARTMSLDPQTGRLFVVGADTDSDPAGGLAHVRLGTLRLMVFEPIR